MTDQSDDSLRDRVEALQSHVDHLTEQQNFLYDKFQQHLERFESLMDLIASDTKHREALLAELLALTTSMRMQNQLVH